MQGALFVSTQYGYKSDCVEDMGWISTPHYSDRLCSDRHYSDNPQSGRRHRVADCSWIGLRAVQIGHTSSNQIPKIRSREQYNFIVFEPWRYVGIFPEEEAPQTSPEYPPHSPPQAPLPSVILVPGSITCFSMHATPRPLPIFSQFLLSLPIYLKRQDYGDVSEKKSHQGRLTKIHRNNRAKRN